MSTCRSCGAAVVWARAEGSGKALPLDPEPGPGGNLVVVGHETGRYGDSVPVVRSVPRSGEPAYVAHFVTCPHASEHRRARRGAARR